MEISEGPKKIQGRDIKFSEYEQSLDDKVHSLTRRWLRMQTEDRAANLSLYLNLPHS